MRNIFTFINVETKLNLVKSLDPPVNVFILRLNRYAAIVDGSKGFFFMAGHTAGKGCTNR